MLYLFLFLLPLVSCQLTTEFPHHTVTYNPGQDCLPYDGSVVPDCPPLDVPTKKPYYLPHSSSKLFKLLENASLSPVSDCSRFWECWNSGENQCLYECDPCQTELGSNPLCEGTFGQQWALTFDVRFQYPVGPVCDWPSTIDCTLGCPEVAECCDNLDCNKCSSGYCNLDWTCSYDPPCE